MDQRSQHSAMGMMASGHELEHLLMQFRYMSSAGYKTTFNLSSEKGHVIASFNVDLGFMQPPVDKPPPSSLSPIRKSPSYYRRLKRRREARESTTIAATNEDTEKVSDVIEAEAEGSIQSESCLDNKEADVSLISNTEAENVLEMDIQEKQNITEEVYTDDKNAHVEVDDRCTLEVPCIQDERKAVVFNKAYGNDVSSHNGNSQKPSALSQLANLTSRLNNIIAEP